MPLEFDIGAGYYKANVFITGLNVDTEIIKVCVNSEATSHKLCHYMNASEEEGQVMSPYMAVHAGIFVFPSTQVPVNTNVTACVTVLMNQSISCKTVNSSYDESEQMIDLSINK
jgi:hypothetical protein